MLQDYTRRKELDYMNAIGCLIVIFIHVASYGITTADPDSWQAFLLYLPWRISGFIVPMFIFNSAIKMTTYLQGRRISPRDYISYILERIKHIYLPYVFWVVIYYLVFWYFSYVNGTASELAYYILTGNLSAQFYYVIIIMQFYLLMPLWMHLVSKVSGFIVLPCAVFIRTVILILSDTGHIPSFYYNFFLTHILYWTIGMYAGKNYDRISSHLAAFNLRTTGIFIIPVIIIAGAAITYTQYRWHINSNLNYLKSLTDLLSIATLWCLSLKLSGASGCTLLKKALTYIHKASYQVYLSHCLFLTIIPAYLMDYYKYSLTTMLTLRAVIGYTLPFALYFLTTATAPLTKHKPQV